ncbi:hypothetical protein D3C86_1914110 [compost metagenome]
MPFSLSLKYTTYCLTLSLASLAFQDRISEVGSALALMPVGAAGASFETGLPVLVPVPPFGAPGEGDVRSVSGLPSVPTPGSIKESKVVPSV